MVWLPIYSGVQTDSIADRWVWHEIAYLLDITSLKAHILLSQVGLEALYHNLKVG